MMRILTVALIVAMVPMALCAEEALLAYSPAPGESWTTEFITKAKIPVVGVQSARARYEITCEAVEGDGFRMSAHMAAAQMPNGNVVGPVDASFILAPDGTISELTSPQLSDPKLRNFVRNVPLLFPKVPGATVATGEEWIWQFVMYNVNPKKASEVAQGRASMPEKIRVVGKFKYEGVEDGCHKLSVYIRQAQGEPMKAEGKGHLCLTIENSRPDSGRITGQVKVKKGFFTITIPVFMSLGNLDDSR